MPVAFPAQDLQVVGEARQRLVVDSDDLRGVEFETTKAAIETSGKDKRICVALDVDASAFGVKA